MDEEPPPCKKQKVDDGIDLCSTKTENKQTKLPPSGAYAKLEGKDTKTDVAFTAFITSLPVTLGRSHDGSPSNFIDLGPAMTASKNHASISFDGVTGAFIFEVFGKGGAVVRQILHKSGSKVTLSSKDPIKIGSLCFYFLQASVDQKPVLNYHELVTEAFVSVGNGTPLGYRDIGRIIEAKYVYYRELAAVSPEKLLQSINRAVRHLTGKESIVKAGNLIGDKRPKACYLQATDDSELMKQVKGALEAGKELNHDNATTDAKVNQVLQAFPS